MEHALESIFPASVILEAHPRCAISVIVQIVHDDGSALSAAVNCTTLALADAGIPMRQLIGSVTLGLSLEAMGAAAMAGAEAAAAAARDGDADATGEDAAALAASPSPALGAVMDLLADEEAAYGASTTLAFGSVDLQQPLLLHHVGAVPWTVVPQLTASGGAAIKPTLAFLSLALKRKVARDAVNFEELPLEA